MNVAYKYAGPSICKPQGDKTVLGLSPDLNRDEKVSFKGKLKSPLVFRDAMLMLREIVISDSRPQKKERTEFFAWLEKEIESRITEHEKHMPGLRESIQEDIDKVLVALNDKDAEIAKISKEQQGLQRKLDSYDVWKDFHSLERKFWKFLYERDKDLWYALDPVITVHPDMVSFEAFSLDESIYGCLSVQMDEFEMAQPPQLGTTNIDFSAKLAMEMKRFRTYTDVELSVNPQGLTVDTGGQSPEYVEKKIDLPETWVKGFCQVSSAANLKGLSITINPVDMYDICAFMRRNKEKKSPRYMKWILQPNEPIRIVFEPFGKEITLSAIYTGTKAREEKIWGRRRWLVAEQLLPLAKSFEIKLLGFGMPQFIIADLGKMKMTIGFTSWSANDWVKGTAFNVMSGFIGEGEYKGVYDLLKEKRCLSMEDILAKLSGKDKNKTDITSGVGHLMKKGEGYFDPIKNLVRFRRLCSEPLPIELYETTATEKDVAKLVKAGLDKFTISMSDKNEFIFSNVYEEKTGQEYVYENRQYVLKDIFSTRNTTIGIDQDGQITVLKCNCTEFNRGPRNISAPCSHILALYMVSTKFTTLTLEQDKEYKINDIMEVLL